MNILSIGQESAVKKMNEKYKILPEEFPCNLQQIKDVESINNIEFPDDFKDFLLQYNGGVVFPNFPKTTISKVDIFPIERFFSIGDIKIISSSKKSELRALINEDYEDELFDLNPKKLVFIARCERGNLLVYCGKDDFGRICYANYSGGEGIEKTEYNSIYSLLDNLTNWDEESPVDLSKIDEENFKSRKIFELSEYFFNKENYDSALIIQRFKEVLDFYGDPNLVDTHYEQDVVQSYINYPEALKYLNSIGAKFPSKLKNVNNLESLKFLISKGIESKGLLNTTRDLEIIKFLVEERGHNLNEPFEGKYPLLNYTNLSGGYSNWSRNKQYELIRDVINLGYDLDLNIKDENGQSVNDRLKILEEHHKKFTAKKK